jgi:2-hydroxy-6-oxonona-2,4-dienedioate hydrolase
MRKWFLVIGFALASTLTGGVWLQYRSDIADARARVAKGSAVVHTPCGAIEYASAGTGRPVLVVHGAGGGFDQGMGFSEPLVARGYRAIAMSRFGYLRTPLPANASAEAQADAHVCLLDALGVKAAAVVGISAGAPSAMQLALRHPGRTDKLVLLVPATFRPRPAGEPVMLAPPTTAVFFRTALRFDFLFWAALKVATPTMIEAILATPPILLENASAAERERVARLLRDILPVSTRRLGLLNDGGVTSALPRYELERIAVPTLVMSVTDDLFGTYENARYTAAHMPQARFVGFPNGGHVWVGQHEVVLAELAAFMGAVPQR